MLQFEWWMAFAAQWNESPAMNPAFVQVEKIVISITDGSRLSVLLNWGTDGALTVCACVPPISQRIPHFSGTLNSWLAFVGGSRSGPSLVARGEVTYIGPHDVLLNLAEEFELLAATARRVQGF